MIQFPSGPGFDPVQAATGVDRSSPAPSRVADPHASLSHTPVDSLALRDAVTAALELELLQHWDDGAARASGAAEYKLALDAATHGDHAASLQHLERSILAHPAYAEAAGQEPAFDAMRGEVRDLVGRMTLVARVRAEATIGDARSAIEPDHEAHPMAAAQQAWLNLAQAQLQSASYAGYVAAAQAAAFAQQIAARSDVVPLVPMTGVKRESLVRPMARAARQTVRRLWQRLPLLLILLIWFLAGIVAGLASLPFQEGSIAEMRQTLFPIWAMGLLGMVVLGFLRSIRRLSRRRGW
ncbi:MAG TPA: hypothetical protein VMT32_01680 [Bryobacteraceae bacterium]|nr:hypothetical protein [Bryobacteraceae bacterium]